MTPSNVQVNKIEESKIMSKEFEKKKPQMPVVIWKVKSTQKYFPPSDQWKFKIKIDWSHSRLVRT